MFGKLVGGEDVLDTLEALPVKPGTERPAKPVRITEVVMYVTSFRLSSMIVANQIPRSYQDPFEEYKTRQERKRARKAEAEEDARTGRVVETKKDGDDINWFGVKVGMEKSVVGANGGGGVGKYLNTARVANAPLKRPVETVPDVPGVPEVTKKKRKIGFGSFEGW